MQDRSLLQPARGGPVTRAFHKVRVGAVVAETDDACSLVFDIPAELEAAFAYQPGQFLTVRIPSELTGSVARCYSLSSSPLTGEAPAVTVKRTADGFASNWIADHVKAGTVLEVLPPAGTFTPGSLDRDFLLLAAGSGITPVMSILSSALAAGRGRVVLVYANRDPDSVIFAERLRSLSASARGRLLVVHWLDCLLGTPTAAALVPLLRPYAGFGVFACGPDPFLNVVKDAAGALGVLPRDVRTERFLSLQDNPFEATEPAGGIDATLTVTLDGQTRQLPWPGGTRMLDLLIDTDLDPPYSCREGICGACACQLVSGEVEMAHNEVLEDDDLADGYILACQSIAVSQQVAISYE